MAGMSPRSVPRSWEKLLGSLVAICIALPLAACADSGDSGNAGKPSGSSGASTSASGSAAAQKFPDVVETKPTREADGTWPFAVTLTYPYDSTERYADGWRILGLDGKVLGKHTLTHDHANEQTVTRTQSEVPAKVNTVTVEGTRIS